MLNESNALPDAESLYHHAACALLLTNKAGVILKVNQAFCNWVGYTREELVGQRRFQELLTVGGQIFHQTHWVPLLEMQRSVSETQFDFKARDGRTVPMVVNVARREFQGRVLDEISAIVIAERHLFELELKTAKRQAEATLQGHLALQRELSVADARLRVALASAQLYIWDVDLHTLERRYDDQVAHLLGFSTAQPVTSEAYASFIAADDRDEEARLFAAAIASSHEYRCVYRLNGVDGVQRTVLATGRGVLDDNERFVQFVGVLHDITEVSLQKVLAEDRALFAEQMVGIVSHDLRNPLQIISMAAQRLDASPHPMRQTALLSHVHEATHRAQRLINDLLDFTQARIGRGLAVAKVAIELGETMAFAIEALRLVYPNRQIDLVIDGDELCYADADRLTQLIGNLIANALAYGDPHSPVTVTGAASANEFIISVHNFGTPIAPPVMATLFEPMTRGAGVDRSVRSVGLGLFIVSEIVKAHDGVVSVVSTAQAGTLFSATFPKMS